MGTHSRHLGELSKATRLQAPLRRSDPGGRAWGPGTGIFGKQRGWLFCAAMVENHWIDASMNLKLRTEVEVGEKRVRAGKGSKEWLLTNDWDEPTLKGRKRRRGHFGEQ